MIGDRQDFLRVLADKLGQEYTADSVLEILRVAEDVAAHKLRGGVKRLQKRPVCV